MSIHSNLSKAVIERLEKYISDIKNNGLDYMNIPDNITAHDCFALAIEAEANGDVLRSIVYNVLHDELVLRSFI